MPGGYVRVAGGDERLLCSLSLFSLRHPHDFKSTTIPQGNLVRVYVYTYTYTRSIYLVYSSIIYLVYRIGRYPETVLIVRVVLLCIVVSQVMLLLVLCGRLKCVPDREHHLGISRPTANGSINDYPGMNDHCPRLMASIRCHTIVLIGSYVLVYT